jgi:hypothetical protein
MMIKMDPISELYAETTKAVHTLKIFFSTGNC